MKAIKIQSAITNRDTASFQRYLIEVQKCGKKGNLTPDEEVELVIKIKQGDIQAERELLLRNLKFVITVAKQYQVYNCELQDLINEGNIGLIKAARKFDETRGYKFISYAVWWVRQSIIAFLNEQGRSVRLPLNKIGQLNKIKKLEEKFEQENCRKPSYDEIIEFMDYETNAEDLSKLFVIDRGIQSLNNDLSQSYKSEGFTLEDTLVDTNSKRTDEALDQSDLKMVLNTALKNMSHNHREVVILHFGLNGGEPLTLEEIGTRLELTRERIRQLKNESLRFLGNKRNSKVLSQYLK